MCDMERFRRAVHAETQDPYDPRVCLILGGARQPHRRPKGTRYYVILLVASDAQRLFGRKRGHRTVPRHSYGWRARLYLGRAATLAHLPNTRLEIC